MAVNKNANALFSLEDTVRKASATFPVMLVTGPRQAGKSTMLERLAEPNRKIVTLESNMLYDSRCGWNSEACCLKNQHPLAGMPSSILAC